MKGKKKGHAKKEVPKIVEVWPSDLELWYTAYIERAQIYDGDTIKNVRFKIFNRMEMEADLRLARINTPEIRGGSEESKKAGLESKQALIDLIVGTPVAFMVHGRGNFGRLIVSMALKDDGRDVSKYMLDNGYAVPYP